MISDSKEYRFFSNIAMFWDFDYQSMKYNNHLSYYLCEPNYIRTPTMYEEPNFFFDFFLKMSKFLEVFSIFFKIFNFWFNVLVVLVIVMVVVVVLVLKGSRFGFLVVENFDFFENFLRMFQIISKTVWSGFMKFLFFLLVLFNFFGNVFENISVNFRISC